MEVVALPGAIRGVLLLLPGPDLALGKAVVVDQGDVARADEAAAAALDAVEQVVGLGLAEVPGAGVPVKLEGLASGRSPPARAIRSRMGVPMRTSKFWGEATWPVTVTIRE